MKEKPPVLSDKEIWTIDRAIDLDKKKEGDVWWIERHYLEAQRDADVEWYGERMQMILDTEYADCVRIDVQQARTEVAREIGEGLCILIGNLMLEDMEGGTKLGNQLEEFIKYQIKDRFLKEEK